MPTPLENNTERLETLKAMAENLSSALTIIDDVTGEKYTLGISEGKLYYKKITDEGATS